MFSSCLSVLSSSMVLLLIVQGALSLDQEKQEQTKPMGKGKYFLVETYGNSQGKNHNDYEDEDYGDYPVRRCTASQRKLCIKRKLYKCAGNCHWGKRPWPTAKRRFVKNWH